MQTETIIETKPYQPGFDDGDHDKFSHYCRKADIVRATIEGIEITALCGKKWVPTRDGEQFPVCPTCKEMYAQGMRL